MIRMLIVVTAFSGVMVGFSHSQETSPTSSAKFVTSQTTEQWVFSRFKGTDVVGPDNVSVGNVNDLLFDRDGKVVGLIVGVGGFLGIGTKNVAMDMSAFDVVPISIVNNERDNNLPGARLAGSAKDPTHVKLKVSWTKDQLKEAPGFAYLSQLRLQQQPDRSCITDREHDCRGGVTDLGGSFIAAARKRFFDREGAHASLIARRRCSRRFVMTNAAGKGKRMKVFQARLGFYDTVVAAPSQAAALRVWGIHQNLFASGQAKITNDAQAIEAALANPETPLKRALGSKDLFALEAASLPLIPNVPKGKGKIPAKSKLAPPTKSPADRSALNSAELALRELDAARKQEEAKFQSRQDELDAEKQVAQAHYVEHRKVATRHVVDARKSYREAGGTD